MNLHTFFNNCIHFIFPQSGDALLVENMTEGFVRSLYEKKRVENIIALTRFSHPCVRALIHEAKFHHNPKAYDLLNILFLQFLDEQASSRNCVIPIPLSRRRFRERGYNQVYEILRVGASKASVSIYTDILGRTRNTKPQTELTRTERLKNMQGSFLVKDGTKIIGKHILLVDDVATTGATLMAAKEALLPHNPASVTLLALAH